MTLKGEIDLVKRYCIYYDWGTTAPTAYGAFCAKKKCCMTYTLCGKCKKYQKERRKKDRRSS